MARPATKLVICLDNAGDESGEDYLYPKEPFIVAALPKPVRRAVLKAA